jgi:hypothetical protein
VSLPAPALRVHRDSRAPARRPAADRQQEIEVAFGLRRAEPRRAETHRVLICANATGAVREADDSNNRLVSQGDASVAP